MIPVVVVVVIRDGYTANLPLVSSGWKQGWKRFWHGDGHRL
jgi:hypothetical protein